MRCQPKVFNWSLGVLTGYKAAVWSRYLWINLLCISVVSVSVTYCCVFCSWDLHVFVLSAFCDCYSLVKWQTLKNREFATRFCFNLKKIASEIYRMPKIAFYDDTMSRVQMLNGIHVISHQTSSMGFECSSPPSWGQTGEDVETMCQVSYEDWIYLMILVTF